MAVSYLQTFAFSKQGFWRPHAQTPKLRFKFELARQASRTSLSASVRAVPWADEAKQQLSRLALSACELSTDIRILGAGLLKDSCTDPQSYV